MERCPLCGTRLPLVQDAFCPECGTDLAEAPEQPAPPEVQQQRRKLGKLQFFQALGALAALGGLWQLLTRGSPVGAVLLVCGVGVCLECWRRARRVP